MINEIAPLCPLSAIHSEGMEAREEGVQSGACPYAIGSDESREWLDGWYECDLSAESDAYEFQRFSPRQT